MPQIKHKHVLNAVNQEKSDNVHTINRSYIHSLMNSMDYYLKNKLTYYCNTNKHITNSSNITICNINQ